MKLLSMLPFKDVFVAQILGNLLGSKYTGMVNFTFDNPVPTSVWLGTDGITHIQHETLINTDAIYDILWLTQGKVGLYPKVKVPDVPALDTQKFIEKLVTQFLPPMPTSCPILANTYLQRDRMKADLDNAFTTSGQELLQQVPLVPIEGVPLFQVNELMKDTIFWPTLFALCLDGQLICNYGPAFAPALKNFKQKLEARLTKMFGARALANFNKNIENALQIIWSERTIGTLPDPIYGTVPYTEWFNILKKETATVGVPTLANKCFEQVLKKLPAQEAGLLTYLYLN